MRTSVTVFGREPVGGRVKTRLAEEVGDAAAAAVYGVLLRHALQVAEASGASIALSLAEAPSEHWSPPVNVPVETQSAGDLGARMAACFAQRFAAGFAGAIVIGSDCPGITGPHLADAMVRLERMDVVLGPATDGGYWLVGQRAPGADLFSGVPWSSRDTLEATRWRLRSLGVGWGELERLSDIDTVADLKTALRDSDLAPHLREALNTAARVSAG